MSTIKHGLRGYRYQGCRCDVCRTANTVRRREDRAKARRAAENDPSTFTHGTLTAYENRGCRCDQCGAAKSAAGAAWFDQVKGLPSSRTKEWLLGRISMDANGCWVWTGHIADNGYGKAGFAYAHRVAWEIYHGEIADGLQIDHLCANRACVNPDHLEPVTQSVNVTRAYARNRAERAS